MSMITTNLSAAPSVAASTLVSGTMNTQQMDDKITDLEQELKTGKDKDGKVLDKTKLTNDADTISIYRNTEGKMDQLKKDGVADANGKVDFTKLIAKAASGDATYNDILVKMTQKTVDEINEASQQNKTDSAIGTVSVDGSLNITA
jgi:hypothetical protein